MNKNQLDKGEPAGQIKQSTAVEKMQQQIAKTDRTVIGTALGQDLQAADEATLSKARQKLQKKTDAIIRGGLLGENLLNANDYELENARKRFLGNKELWTRQDSHAA